MTQPAAERGSSRRQRGGRHADGSERWLALRLVAGGLAFAVVCILINAWLDVSIGRLHVIAALAFVGLLAAVAGGVFALIAIARRGERSTMVLCALAVSLLALLVIVAQVVFDLP